MRSGRPFADSWGLDRDGSPVGLPGVRPCVAKQAAGMFVSLGRVDALVFTGGIGENQVHVRAQILELLRFAGFVVDPRANQLHGRGLDGRITRSTSPMAAVVGTNEELMIAMDTAEIVLRDAHRAACSGRGGELRPV